MRLSLRVDTSAFTAFIARAEAALQSGALQDAMAEASDIYHESMRSRFVSASNGDGTWAPLAESTLKQRGAGSGILVKTGSLEASLQRGADDHVLEVTPQSVIEGTADPKAGFQHFGTKRIPARPIYVYPSDETLDDMKVPISGAVRMIFQKSQ